MGYGTFTKWTPNGTDCESLSAVTTGTGKGKPVNDCREIWGSLVSSGTISGGAIVFEANSVSPDYSGTWHNLDTVDSTDFTALSGGATYETARFAGTYGFTRWRITSNVTGGGSITAKCNGLLG